MLAGPEQLAKALLPVLTRPAIQLTLLPPASAPIKSRVRALNEMALVHMLNELHTGKREEGCKEACHEYS